MRTNFLCKVRNVKYYLCKDLPTNILIEFSLLKELGGVLDLRKGTCAIADLDVTLHLKPFRGKSLAHATVCTFTPSLTAPAPYISTPLSSSGIDTLIPSAAAATTFPANLPFPSSEDQSVLNPFYDFNYDQFQSSASARIMDLFNAEPPDPEPGMLFSPIVHNGTSDLLVPLSATSICSDLHSNSYFRPWWGRGL